MRKIFLLFTAFILFQLTSCETTEPQPPKEKKPPGYQEDIPWPSLADSPWPMAHHDPQSNGRSKMPGPTLGEKIWEYKNNSSAFFSGITISPDSTIYTTANDSLGNTLYALSISGQVKNKILLSNWFVKNFNSPLIRKDGSIIVSDYINTIYAISPDGTVLWKYTTDGKITSESVSIDREGNLYFTSFPNKFVVLSSNGNLSWEINDDKISCTIASFIVTFSPDGKTAYLPGCKNAVIAVSVDEHVIKWVYGEKPVGKSIVVDAYGNIYFEQGTEELDKVAFMSVNSDGKLNWTTKFRYLDAGPDNTPAIDKKGNLYFGSDTLYSVDYKGELRWKIGLDGICDSPIICDESGTIYVTATTQEHIKIYSVNESGIINWTYLENESFGTAGSSAIGFNNKFICPIIYNGKIITIK